MIVWTMQVEQAVSELFKCREGCGGAVDELSIGSGVGDGSLDE